MSIDGLPRTPTLTFMNRGVVRPILGLCLSLLLTAPATAQRLAYAPLPYDSQVVARPRVTVLPLPIDDRIAPDDFALDDLVEPVDVAEQSYTPRPAIWRIGDADTTIWMFGTVHVLPPGFAWRSPALDAIAARADSLLVEAVDDGKGLLDTASDTALLPLQARVSPGHRAKLAALQTTLDTRAAAILDGLPTWIAAVAVGMVREIRTGELPGPGADSALEADFRRAGKPVVAIENAGHVLARVNAIPESEQRRMLDAALDAPTPTRASLRAPLDAWARGTPDAGIAPDIGSPALGTALLDERNVAWAAALQRRLAAPGRVLFAAGAGHFLGPRSVLNLLEARGIKVTRVQ